MGIFSLVIGRAGPSGFGSASTAEQVTEGVDASNITAIVTGGASGIGLETARVLALRRAHVIIAARNLEAANEAKQLILTDNQSAKVDVLKLDLCSIKSVREFVDSFNALDLPLNILINNAGVMFCPHQLSEDGIEVQFATNHLGHFLLTNLLLEKMKNTAKTTGLEGRIVNLSSVAHSHPYDKGIRFDKINDRSGYSELKAYGQSKLANIMHANELSRRLQEEGVNITVNSVHPGLIMTPLMRHSPLLMSMLNVPLHPYLEFLRDMPACIWYTDMEAYVVHHVSMPRGAFKLVTFCLWKTVPQGAATTLFVALHPKLKGVTGKYYADCNEMKPSKYASDEKLAKQLWDFSNKLIDGASKI